MSAQLLKPCLRLEFWLLFEEVQEEDFMDGFPAMVDEWKVESFDDLVWVIGGLEFGKAAHTAIDAVAGITAEDGGGLVDLFSAVMAEDSKIGIVSKLNNGYFTTMLSRIVKSSGAAFKTGG